MAAWIRAADQRLCQGDLLRGISIPLLRSNFPEVDDTGGVPMEVEERDVVVLTQSCDLENRKVDSVVVAAVDSVDEHEANDPAFAKGGKWKQCSQGRIEGLHLLFGPGAEDKPRQCLVVDFRVLASLPVDYVEAFANAADDRWRLQPPYVEHLSQAFARFFMRVALPVGLPEKI